MGTEFSHVVGLSWRTTVHGDLCTVPWEAGAQSREVQVLVGCLALSFFCVIYFCSIILLNLSDLLFHCNRFGTERAPL